MPLVLGACNLALCLVCSLHIVLKAGLLVPAPDSMPADFSHGVSAQQQKGSQHGDGCFLKRKRQRNRTGYQSSSVLCTSVESLQTCVHTSNTHT